MIEHLILPALNHLLSSESWATSRLRPHAGNQVLIDAAPLRLHLAIDSDGMFTHGGAEQPASVTISLPGDTPARFLVDRKSLFQSAKLSGSVELAEVLGFVFRNLNWDIEADLAKLIGDIPARRLEMLRVRAFNRIGDSLSRVAQNLTEYAAEESGALVTRGEISAFGGAVDQLRDDLARLEKKIQRL